MGLSLLFHVGPHKTATTTLQYAFNSLRGVLKDQRVFYPKGIHESGAHHVLAWQILQRPLGFLGFKDSEVVPPQQRLTRWVEEAVAANCDTLFLSAEDFSLLGDEEWGFLIELSRNHNQVSSIGVVFVSRDLTSMASSAYGTLVMFGENRSFEQLESALERRFERVFRSLDRLTGREGIVDRRIELKFESIANSGKVVEQFFEQTLRIQISNQDWPVLNTSFGQDVIEATRVWNTTNCPGVTIQDDSGDFPREVFTLDPTINQRRAEFVAELLHRRCR